MAVYDNNLSDEMGALFVEKHWIEFGLDDNIQKQLRKIKNDFESVFSLDIHKSSEFNQDLFPNFIDKVKEKLSMIIDDIDKNEFNFYRFILQLIVIYEDYMSKRYKESYEGIETIVTLMEECRFDESNQQCSDAYHHIARASKMYIALTLKIDSENLLNDVKPAKNFNATEKAAICAVKARIFMNYPPKGNDIALELTELALTLHRLPEWLLIWSKAKKLDYKNAKMHFSRAKRNGNFNSSLQLIKVECLRSVHEFPYVQTLNEMYNDFQTPYRRVIILIHILIYYNYCENNTKEMMRYVKLYIDQDIEDTFKKRQLMFVRSLFNVGRFLKPNDFLNDLFANVKELINNNKWNEEEKMIIENIFDRFIKILSTIEHSRQ